MSLLTKNQLLESYRSDQYLISDKDEKELALSEINFSASKFNDSMAFDIFISYNMDDCRIPLGLKRILGGRGFSSFVKDCDSEDREINYTILDSCSSLLYLTTLSRGPLTSLPWQMRFMIDQGKRISIVPILDEALSLYGIETLWEYPYLDYTDDNLYIHKDSSSWINLENWLKGEEPKKFNLTMDF